MVDALRLHVVAVALALLLGSCEGRTVRQQEGSNIARTPVTLVETSSGAYVRPGVALSLLLQRLNPLSWFIHCSSGGHLSSRRHLLVAVDPLQKNARSRNGCSAWMTAADASEVTPEKRSSVKAWPCGDSLDKDILRQVFPLFLNFLVLPLTGVIDLVFVGKLGSTLAIAGQAAADRIYTTAGLLNVVAAVAGPRVSKASASGDQDLVQREVGAGIFMSGLIALLIGLGMGVGARYWLLAIGNKAGLSFSLPYFMGRLLGHVPAAVALIGFSALVATKDALSALKVTVLSLMVNAVLNYVLMFPCGLGITGAALATSASQVVSCVALLGLLMRRNLLNLSKAFRPPSREMLSELSKAVGSLQIRNIASNIALLATTKVTQNLDSTGLAASAHTVAASFWQLGGVLLFAFATAGQTLTSGELGKADSTPEAARATARRALSWGAVIGTMVGALQLLGLPLIKLFTPVPEVQEAARMPMTIAALIQPFNGVTFVGESLMNAANAMGRNAKGMVISVAAFLLALKVAPSTLPGVWLSFWAWMLVRFANVVYFFWFSESSLKPAGDSSASSISKGQAS